MSCPWGKIEQPKSVSLTEIMSEQVAKELQDKEYALERTLQNFDKGEETVASVVPSPDVIEDIPTDVLSAMSPNNTVESDHAIALLLQMQEDKEYDQMLRKTEKKFNGDSKVSISYKNFERAKYNPDFESDTEEEVEDILQRKHWDRFDKVLSDPMPLRGYKMDQNGQIVTKHDLVNSGRKNACKMLGFPPEFQTGDGENFDLKLSNKVFNGLKMHSKKEQSRKHKNLDKKESQATTQLGLDEPTTDILYKLTSSEILEDVQGIISTGKEAIIFYAVPFRECTKCLRPLSDECVLKVFRTTITEFKQRAKYIKDDFRFKNRIGKQSSKKTIDIWAEKEMANLTRLKRAGLKCPDIFLHKQNVLLMSFIGKDHIAAPKLKDAQLTDEEWIMAYKQVVKSMRIIYNEAKLIHADLSEYNILWHEQECYFIDVSQSVEPSHENAFHFLYRDCQNICNFFTKKGVPDILDEDELFKKIVGHHYTDRLELMAVQEAFKMKPHLVDEPGIESRFFFETAWEKTQKGELSGKTGTVSPSITDNGENSILIDTPVV